MTATLDVLREKTKLCKICGAVLAESFFHKNGPGRRPVCKACVSHARLGTQKYVPRILSEPRRGNKYAARRKVLHALVAKRISKPQSCSVCKNQTPRHLLHAHHCDYNKPLDIVWICNICHAAEHAGYLHISLEKRKHT